MQRNNQLVKTFGFIHKQVNSEHDHDLFNIKQSSFIHSLRRAVSSGGGRGCSFSTQRFDKVTITLLEVPSLLPPPSNKRKYISTAPLLKNGYNPGQKH